MNNRGKRVFVIVAALLMLLAFAGCQSGTGTDASATNSAAATAANTPAATTASTTAAEPIVVSLLVKELGSQFWLNVQQGAEDACAELGWTMRMLCPQTGSNNEQQIALIQQDLLDPPDLYILAPADSQGIRPAIEAINEAGIPIINYSTLISNDDNSLEVVSFVGVDYVTISETLAEAMAEHMDYQGNCVIIEGTTGSQTAIDILKGTKDTYEKYADIHILDSQVANYKRDQGVTVTQNLLQKYDNIDWIDAANLESAMGAVVALEQASRTDIKICTRNISAEGAQALKDGKLTMIADDDPYLVAYTAIMTGKDYLDGKQVEGTVIVPCTIVIDGTDTAKEYYDQYGIN